MTYDDYVNTMVNQLVIDSSTEAAFNQILPSMITYSENRIENDLDLISTVTSDTIQLRANARTASIPGCIYIVNSVNVISPSATNPDSGTRIPLQRLSVEAMNFMWPDASATDVPQNYAILNDTTAIFGPVPDAPYRAEFYGIYRPAPLSATNTTTWISNNIPELMIAASCVYGFGWQRDYSGQSSDPSASMSWESQYQALMQADKVQEYRKKAQSSAWQPFEPTPLATPPRA